MTESALYRPSPFDAKYQLGFGVSHGVWDTFRSWLQVQIAPGTLFEDCLSSLHIARDYWDLSSVGDGVSCRKGYTADEGVFF